jgi:hypothetical protein
MAAKLNFYLDRELTNPITEGLNLTDTVVPDEEMGTGEPIQVYCANSGDTILRQIKVYVEGNGMRIVQLAKDDESEPGVWAAPGESILVREESLIPESVCSFWIRPVYDSAQDEGQYPVKFIVSAKSVK